MASDVEVAVELPKTIATNRFLSDERICAVDKWQGINIEDYEG